MSFEKPRKPKSKAGSKGSSSSKVRKPSHARRQKKVIEKTLTRKALSGIICKAGLNPRMTKNFLNCVNIYFTEYLMAPILEKAAHICVNGGVKTISQKHMSHAIGASQYQGPKIYM